MNEFIRVANSNMLSCSQCDYTTSSNDELMRHNMAHLIANQQQQTPTATLVNLYQNLAAAQQQNQSLLNQQQSQQSQNHHNGVSNSLLANAPEILNGILPDSSKELAVHIQQELLKVRLQQQQQQEEESRRQAVHVAAALAASVSNGNSTIHSNSIVNSSLASALLAHQNNVDSISDVSNSLNNDQNSHHLLSDSVLSNGISAGVVQHLASSSSQFHSSTTTSSSFGCLNDDEELHLPHSLSPVPSSGRRDSIDSESTSGGDSVSKTCSISPGSETQTPGGGSRKRKPSKIIKVDQISVKLRDKCLPGADGKRTKKFDSEEMVNIFFC